MHHVISRPHCHPSSIPLCCQGRSKGFAHVDFQNPELATRAVTELNGMELLGRSLRIDLAQRKEDRPAGSDGMREVGYTPHLPSFQSDYSNASNQSPNFCNPSTHEESSKNQ